MTAAPAARPDFTELKKKHRAVWASGDYRRIARGIQGVADHLVRIARIRPGERVLDVACGTGNTTLAARANGAAVTGLDLTPELIAIGRDRAADEGFDDIRWEVGDAERLPFEDGSFDVVVSSCGLMFAPDQARVAEEVARVIRPGGRVAIQAWTEEGGVGRMFALTSRHVPPPPNVPSPFRWGDATVARGLLGSGFVDHRFEHFDCPEFADTPEQLAELFLTAYGPTHRAHAALEPAAAAAFRAELTAFYRGYQTPIDGKVRWGREYLITIATRI